MSQLLPPEFFTATVPLNAYLTLRAILFAICA